MSSQLEKFREAVKTKKKARVLGPWKHTVMAFDQSLANTGWAFIIPTGTQPMVGCTGMITTPAVGTSIEGMLERSCDIHAEIYTLLQTFAAAHEDLIVVHEQPIMGPGGHEAALMAAEAVRIAGAMLELPVRMVHAQLAKTHMTQKANASKAEVTEAVKRRMPDLKDRKVRPLNQHVCDAIAAALYAGEMGVL